MPARHGNNPTDEPLVIGVLLVGDGVQFLDVAPADLLGMMQKSYLAACELPEEIVNQGIDDIRWHFISEAGEGMYQMTSGFQLHVTDSIYTCPPLDILIIGGPPLDHVPHPHVTEFLEKQLNHLEALLTICAGYLPVLHSGLFANKTATAPKPLLPALRKDFADVKWVEKRWARDGKIWTSGGITNGLDLMAAFMREKWGNDADGVVETVLRLADAGERGEHY